jgi:murein DD-endopeptidase MepM/ murein hydrolase activator NlpD
MRSSLNRGLVAKALMTVATAALLAGCSNSIERFQSAYDNPSDADPVYTASVPQAKKKIARAAIKRPSYDEPTYEASANDVIEESPIKRAAIPLARKPKDFAAAYQPSYKQPGLTSKKPKLIPAPEEVVADVGDAAEEYVAPAAVKAPFKKAQLVKPKLLAPPVEEIADAEVAVPKKKIKFNQPAPVSEEDVVAETAPVVKTLKAGALHTVASGDTLYALGRKYGVSPFVIAQANGLDTNQQLTLGQKVKIPGAKAIKAAPVEAVVADAEPTVNPVKPRKKPPLALAEEEQVAADGTDGEAAIGEAPKKIIAEAKPVLKEQPVAEAAIASPAGLNLRWPLKGKVISGYGNKPGGLKNEGINISVPEGTSIRAADTGVVAYAGNELKGYGNLVLIRHAGGYVTAYAHAKELLVKRGDKIDRGAIIGKAGQTGSVSSPQLHFEVRKGATALDPMKYMTSTTASN